VKDDAAVTDEDVRTKNLILFGDPGSNKWIAQALPNLPLTWSQETLQLGGRDYPARDHMPALIAPNPLSEPNGHYVVLNSGHTFHEAELEKLNYLLFPRWGDWAVIRVDPMSIVLRGCKTTCRVPETLMSSGTRPSAEIILIDYSKAFTVEGA